MSFMWELNRINFIADQRRPKPCILCKILAIISSISIVVVRGHAILCGILANFNLTLIRGPIRFT